MIESIRIERFRGIQHGVLEDLAPLTVFTGPNGSGKTSVLEAIRIAASPIPTRAVVEIIRRRCARFAATRLATSPYARIEIDTTRGDRIYKLEPHNDWDANDVVKLSLDDGGEGPDLLLGEIAFTPDNQGQIQHPANIDTEAVVWIDPTSQEPLSELYSHLAREGKHKLVAAALRRVMPRSSSLAILTERGDSELYVVPEEGAAVPVSESGDGIHAFVRLAIQLAAGQDGLVIIEEPETFQHPRAMMQTCDAIWDAVTSGTQVMLSTHSLELIDMLVEAGKERLALLALFNLGLGNGTLSSSRLAGAQIQQMRGTIQGDLR